MREIYAIKAERCLLPRCFSGMQDFPSRLGALTHTFVASLCPLLAPLNVGEQREEVSGKEWGSGGLLDSLNFRKEDAGAV